jgi:hypothetical protein
LHWGVLFRAYVHLDAKSEQNPGANQNVRNSCNLGNYCQKANN